MKEQLSLRYPIGMFEYGKEYSNLDTLRHIREIADLPKKLKKIVKKLREGALDKTYRQHGWTVRQVIHHLADSHMNAYIRMKLAVTENAPIVKPYDEQLWAEMEDGKHGSVGMSLKLLSALHKRWVFFLSHLTDEDLDRVYYNPSGKRTVQVREAIALYTWHGKHHFAHVKLVAGSTGKHEAGETKAVNAGIKKVSKSGKAEGAAGKAAGDVSGETDAPKRRGRPPLAKPAARPSGQSRKKGTKDVTGTAAGEIAADKAAVISTTEKVSKTRVVKSADAAEKPRRGRPAVNKVESSASAELPPVVVPETPSEKPRRGRPAVNKVESSASAELPPVVVLETPSEKPRRGRPAVNKVESSASAELPPVVVLETPSEKPRRGRPAVNRTAAPEKPKRSRRTPEDINAEKKKKG